MNEHPITTANKNHCFAPTVVFCDRLFLARDAVLPSAILSTSRLLADKARPFLPAAAAPALEAASENPVAAITTIVVSRERSADDIIGLTVSEKYVI